MKKGKTEANNDRTVSELRRITSPKGAEGKKARNGLKGKLEVRQ